MVYWLSAGCPLGSGSVGTGRKIGRDSSGGAAAAGEGVDWGGRGETVKVFKRAGFRRGCRGALLYLTVERTSRDVGRRLTFVVWDT